MTGERQEGSSAKPFRRLIENAPPVLFLCLFLPLAVRFYLAAGNDDTFIMLWAGQSFTLSKWFVNYNYVPQEIASSHLAAWVAALTKGWEPGRAVLFCKIAGLAAASLVFCGLWFYRKFLSPERQVLVVSSIFLATVVSPSFGYWIMGGLETPYHAGFLTLYALFLANFLAFPEEQARNAWPVAIASSLLVLTRTEGFWTIALSLVFVLRAPDRGLLRANLLRAAGLPLLVFALTVLLRLHFTGQVWPNPVYAKVGANKGLLLQGIGYVREYLVASRWNSILGVGFLYAIFKSVEFFLKKPSRPEPGDALLAAMGAVMAGQAAFVVMNGGSWMGYYRFIAPIIPIANAAAFVGAYRIINRAEKRFRFDPVFVFLFFALLSLLSLSQIGTEWDRKNTGRPKPLPSWDFGIDSLARHVIEGNSAHMRDLRSIKPFIEGDLREIVNASPRPVIAASYQAGFFPYYLRRNFTESEVRFIDTVGLTDKRIASLPGRRSSIGYVDGTKIDRALLADSESPLHGLLATEPPDIVYLTWADREIRKNFASLGYKPIVDNAGAVVFYKKKE